MTSLSKSFCIAGFIFGVCACGTSSQPPAGPTDATAPEPIAPEPTADAALDAVANRPDSRPSHEGPWEPVLPEIAARAAVILGSCTDVPGIQGALQDIYYLRSAEPVIESVYREKLACLANATSGCAAIAECLGISYGGPGACVRKCDGTKVTACSGSVRVDYDCARFGMTCRQNDEGLVSCAPQDAPRCNDTDPPVETCEDGRPKYCDRGALKNDIRCSDYGLECNAGRCIGRGAACNLGSYVVRPISFATGTLCQENTLTTCIYDRATTIGCDAFAPGFACQEYKSDAQPSAIYCGLGAECRVEGRSAPQCDGNSIVVCNAGRLDKIDCTSLGFTGCNPHFGCYPNLYSRFDAGF